MKNGHFIITYLAPIKKLEKLEIFGPRSCHNFFPEPEVALCKDLVYVNRFTHLSKNSAMSSPAQNVNKEN